MVWRPCMSFIASCASIQYGNGKSLMRLKQKHSPLEVDVLNHDQLIKEDS